MQTITLNNDVTMPILGFGVYQVDPADCERVVSEALEAGYRHIDTAAAYFNEEAVGRAIAASGIPRDELFVTTKLWVSDAGEKAAREAFERQTDKLSLETLDLYLVHQPFGDYYGSWRTMEDLYSQGRIRAIGVSNFDGARLIDLIAHNEVVPAVNQVETHPFHQRVADQKVMEAEGVRIESWGPFAEGRNGLFTNPVLTEIGAAHGKSAAQVTLRWLIQRGVVAIPKSVHRDRMEQNLDVFDFELSSHDMARIADLDEGKSSFIDHTNAATARMLAGIKA